MYQNVSLADNQSCYYTPGESSVLWWNSVGGIKPSEVLFAPFLTFFYILYITFHSSPSLSLPSPSLSLPSSLLLLTPWQITLPAILAENGYTTALVGKWHVGIGRNYEYAKSWQEWRGEKEGVGGRGGERWEGRQVGVYSMTFWGYLPTNRGFQHFYGIPLWHMGDEGNQSQVPSYSFHRSLPLHSPLSFLWTLLISIQIPDVPLMNNLTIIGRLYADIPTNTLTPRYVDYITQFLNQNKDNPFFLVHPSLPPSLPPPPFLSPPSFSPSSPRYILKVMLSIMHLMTPMRPCTLLLSSRTAAPVVRMEMLLVSFVYNLFYSFDFILYIFVIWIIFVILNNLL